MKKLAVSEIAAAICKADNLNLDDNEIKYSQVRNLVRHGVLRDGVQVDRRGTLAFPILELYRARILTRLADIVPSVADFGDVMYAEVRHGHVLPTRCKGNWHGLRSIVEGVANGEAWWLEIKYYAPGQSRHKRFTTGFVWEGDERLNDAESACIDESFGAVPLHAVLRLDLKVLFANLPELQSED